MMGKVVSIKGSSPLADDVKVPLRRLLQIRCWRFQEKLLNDWQVKRDVEVRDGKYVGRNSSVNLLESILIDDALRAAAYSCGS